MSDLILCTSNDGQTRLQLRADGQTVWPTQAETAELFQTTKNAEIAVIGAIEKAVLWPFITTAGGFPRPASTGRN